MLICRVPQLLLNVVHALRKGGMMSITFCLVSRTWGHQTWHTYMHAIECIHKTLIDFGQIAARSRKGLLRHENEMVLLHAFHSYTNSLADIQGFVQLKIPECATPIGLLVVLVEGKKTYVPIHAREIDICDLWLFCKCYMISKQGTTLRRLGKDSASKAVRRPRSWSSFVWACGGSGASRSSRHSVTAHRKFRILSWRITAAQINGLSNLVCMFIGRVAHQLFQIVDSVSQCSMLLQRALGGKEQPKRLTDAEFEKFEAKVKAFMGHQGWARSCDDSPAFDGPALLGFSPDAIRRYRFDSLISFWSKCLTLRLSVVHDSELLTCLSSRAWVSWVSKRDSTDIAWLLVGWKVGSTSIPGIGPANHQTAAPRKPNGPLQWSQKRSSLNVLEVPTKLLKYRSVFWCLSLAWSLFSAVKHTTMG